MVRWATKILVILTLIVVGHPQEHFAEPLPDIIPIGNSGPVVFIEPMQRASKAIATACNNALGENDWAWFLSDGYWPTFINNSSIINITA